MMMVYPSHKEKLFFMSFIDLFFINGMGCYVTYYLCLGLAPVVRSVRTYGADVPHNMFLWCFTSQ